MHRLLLLIIAFCLLGQRVEAITIVLDYNTDDAASQAFFDANSAATAALNAAAADISAVITSSLSAISGTGVTNVNNITGTNGTTDVTANWGYTYNNPSTGTLTTISNPTVPANTVTIFVGMRALSGTTLGIGGPGGTELGLAYAGPGSGFAGAFANMETASNTYMGRGAGPVIGNITGSDTYLGGTANYSLTYGAAIGSLSLDIDSIWHYDHTTTVGLPGKNDFYSVALHEILHVLGMGTSDTWDSLVDVDGTTWLGDEASDLNGGTGANLVFSDGTHIANAFMSSSIYDGTGQEAVMDPTLAVGTRKYLTQMDLAMMRDIGWQTVPEPGRALLCLSGIAFVLLRRRR